MIDTLSPTGVIFWEKKLGFGAAPPNKDGAEGFIFPNKLSFGLSDPSFVLGVKTFFGFELSRGY